MTTGLGEVLHFTMDWPGHTPAEIRTLLDWEVAYELRTVSGVVEVNGWGGDTRQIDVLLRPADLIARKLTQEDVEKAIEAGGRSTGGGAIVHGGEQSMIRLDGQYRTAEAIAAQVVTMHDGVPILVRDVATVSEGARFRLSAATRDGQGETVYGMVQMIAGGNAHEIVARVRGRLDEVAKRLPKGARVSVFYDRASLVDRVLHTVRHSLVEGGVVVVVVLLVLLGHCRARARRRDHDPARDARRLRADASDGHDRQPDEPRRDRLRPRRRRRGRRGRGARSRRWPARRSRRRRRSRPRPGSSGGRSRTA